VGTGPAGPLALLAAALVVDVWVYVDARRRDGAGRGVVAEVGPLKLATPGQWFVASLLLWVVVLPLYLVARRA